MARTIKVKDLKREITKTFKNKLQTEINKPSFKKQIVKESMDMIYKRAKTGYGVKSDEDPNTKPEKFKKLSPRYRKFRRGVKLGENATPTFSNVTLSGQLLKAFGWTLKLNGFKIFIKRSRRKGIELKNGKKITTSKTNAEIHDYVRKTRPFLNLTSREQKIIKKYYEKLVRSLARRF